MNDTGKQYNKNTLMYTPKEFFSTLPTKIPLCLFWWILFHNFILVRTIKELFSKKPLIICDISSLSSHDCLLMDVHITIFIAALFDSVRMCPDLLSRPCWWHIYVVSRLSLLRATDGTMDMSVTAAWVSMKLSRILSLK